MNNEHIAKLLRQVATTYILKGENRFKIIAYERAADAVERSMAEIKDLWENGQLSTLPGIGPAIEGHLDELFRTGKVTHFNNVLKSMSQSVFILMEIPGFGPKKAYKLVAKLKLNNPNTAIDDLYTAARQGKIAQIEGFGDKSQAEIIESLERFKRGQIKIRRMTLPYANIVASDVLSYLKRNPDTIQAVPLGSLRRMVTTIGDIDIAVATKNPKSVISWFLHYPKIQNIVEKGPSGATIILDSEWQIDLRVQYPEKFGAMLQYFTGSKNHNIHLRELVLKQGLSLSEYGIRPLRKIQKSKFKNQNYKEKFKLYEFSTEKELYQTIGLPWIPPELREDAGEIEAAQNKKLPKLVELDDIKGDFHIHSNYDLQPSHDLGTSKIKEIINQADNLDYEYIGISDHNPSFSNHSISQIITIMKRRKQYFEQKIESIKCTRVNLFIMLEIDILPNGKLALPNEAFEYLDAAIVSIHSRFQMDKYKMTQRIISGLSHPKAKIFAHPTGRLIGVREGYEADWAKIFSFCRENDKAIEINSYPQRLDLPDTLVREAIKEKIKLVIDTDSHEFRQMNMMSYGVSVARRGWATKDDIINTLPYNKVKDWLFRR